MILHALVERYEDLAKQGKIAKPGWGPAKVSYALSLSQDGELLDVVGLPPIETQQGKRTVSRPQEMQVPEPVKRSSGVAANFLCDTSSYFLGMDNKGKPARTKECFQAAKNLHEKVLEQVDSPVATAILRFFHYWATEGCETHPALVEKAEDVKAGSNLIFRVDGVFAQDDPEIARAWQAVYEEKEGDTATCLVTGEEAHIARLHPSIKGVRGAQSSGATLVGFNSDSLCSYEKKQGENAPVGEYAAFAYGAALNALLADREHTQLLGDMTLVFWAKGGESAYQSFFGAMLGKNEDEMTDSSLKAAMTSLAKGETTKWAGVEINPATPFYILGLSPNAARLSVRFFLQNSFGAIAQRMKAHQERLEIARPAYDRHEELPFWALIRETVNQKSRDKKASPVMEGELVRAVLTDGKYSATLLNGVMLRIRAEKEVTRGRAAIIKAYYLKNKHKDCPREVLTVALNESKHTPYLLGRAFSVLEAIQQSANPGINTTIKDKYFNSASATPATIFPILISLTQHHLRKLEKGLHIHYEKELTAILGEIADFPKRLTLPEQGAFQLGYYHQTQKRYEKKKED
ncbi:MAG: type I-C CRISPR-associated protein Cas8c/Csd1 [Oscillospiraceae bacterium]|nr:type I-C CRISPR-associated protein Cas8c/Csd1 [Oscillospiraceae bacterium]